MKEESYIALRPAASGLVDIELGLRISMAFYTEQMGIPYVHAPIKIIEGFCKSELSPDIFNQKWEQYFRLLAKEFRLMSQQYGKCLYLNDGLENQRAVINIDAFEQHKTCVPELISWAVKNLYKDKVLTRSQLAKTLRGVDAQKMLAFASRSHSAYMAAFGRKSRKPFEDNILQAVFILTDDGLKAPFFYELLLPLADLIEEQARLVGCRAEIKLFTSFKTDTPQTTAFQKQQEEILELARACPNISHREMPSFEEVMDAVVTADLRWISGSLYGRTFIRDLFFFIARPGQVSLEAVVDPSCIRFNACFVMWDGKHLSYEREKLCSQLRKAREAHLPEHKFRLANTMRRLFPTTDVPRLFPISSSKKRDIKIALVAIDGVGSYATKAFILQSIVDHYGFSYVHAPPPYFDHNHKGEDGWVQKWTDFLMIGDGYPQVSEVFEGVPENIDYFYHLPRPKTLHSLRHGPRSLVACSMGEFWLWPMPQNFLWQKIVAARDAFREKHKNRQDRLRTGTLNVAVHIRRENDLTLPMLEAYKSTHEPFTQYRNFSRSMGHVGALYSTLEQLKVPFRMHVYSDMFRQDMQPLLELGDMQLHAAEDSEDHTLDFLEMSRADILMVAPSRLSHMAAVLAKPNQLQIVIDDYEPELMYLITDLRKAIYAEDVAILRDVQFIEEGLKQRNFL